MPAAGRANRASSGEADAFMTSKLLRQKNSSMTVRPTNRSASMDAGRAACRASAFFQANRPPLAMSPDTAPGRMIAEKDPIHGRAKASDQRTTGGASPPQRKASTPGIAREGAAAVSMEDGSAW